MATRNPSTHDFTTASNAAIDTILAEEAGRIGSDIHKRVMHTSPWIDLIKKSAFPDGMGYKLSTMIYDRTLPTTDATGSILLSGSAGWNDVGAPAGETRTGSLLDQANSEAIDSFQGANGPGGTALGTSGDQRNFVNFSKQIKQYNIKRCIIESPRISVDDLRYAAHRTEQLRAVMDSLAESTRWSWENRYRSEFDRISDNVVACASGSVFESGHEGTMLEDLVDTQLIGTVTLGADSTEATADDVAPGVTHNISNKVLDKVRNQLIRRGAGREAYGRENGAPVFALVLSSEASYNIMTESADIRQDIRYNSGKVSDLIAPLGVEQSFRGFYHLIDDLTPRYKGTASGNKLAIVQPFKVANGITIENPEYESAPFEAAFVLHPQVMEAQIPQPFSGASGVAFDPVSYTGDYKWKNIVSEHANPDGSIGFFRGVLSSASKPIKTEMGYTIVFKRNTASATI